MRTKALVLAGAVSLAGIASSLAQSNVYSVNVVGYINVTLNSGFTMMANQLDLDGTGTNNTVNTVFSTNLPSGSAVYAFSGGSFGAPAGYSTKGGWSGGLAAANAALNPGGGVFVKVPSTAAITLVGNVKQGSLTTPLAAGYNIVGSQVPQAGLIATDLGFVPGSGDSVQQWDSVNQVYLAPKGYSTKGGWAPSQPTIGVAEGFWLKSAAGGTWTRNFTVQ